MLARFSSFVRPVSCHFSRRCFATLSRDEAKGIVIDIASKISKAPVTELSSFADFVPYDAAPRNWDEFDTAEFLLTLEELLSVSIPDEVADKLSSVSDTIDYLVTVDVPEVDVPEATESAEQKSN